VKALVTGAGGFSGRRLVAQLGAEAVAVTRADCDLSDAVAVRALLARIRPERIYHLAGTFSNVPEEDYCSNVLTSRNLLEAAADLGLGCRLLLVGSAAEYGPVGPGEGPIDERRPLRPTSVYGLSKVCQTLLMRAGAPGVEIVMARTFNLVGAGASPALLVGRVGAWVAGGAPGRLQLGRLDDVRDYLPVDDGVAAYRRIMAHGRDGEVYNVGSGRPTLVRDLVAELAGPHRDRIDEAPETRGVGSAAGEVVADITKLGALGR